MEQNQSPSLEDCLKLLKGERDEQRLAGLLLVTKFCKGDDLISLRRIYDAVGIQFLDRLLRTGMRRCSDNKAGNNSDAYLQLSVTVLAAFCRIPEVAASKDMVSKIPLILEIMPDLGSPVLEECYELLYLVTAACEDGSRTLLESGGMKVLASQMHTFPDGSHMMELAMKIVQSMLSKLSRDVVINEHESEVSMVVGSIARQFAVQQNMLKFEALHILSDIFSSNSSVLHETLRSTASINWPDYMRVGIMAILQNRLAPAEKLHALILAESVVAIVGEKWLVGQPSLPELQDSRPADMCLLLVLESSRVEVAVLLNELAYTKYEASKDSSRTAENILLKQQNVAIAFSLVERIIKLVATVADEGELLIGEDTFMKVINALNEAINVVLEYLQDAKEHGQKKGDDLLASVRVVGSYLAETPNACQEKVRELLEYMLTIEGEDEPSPFQATCFLLPMLCQITMEVEGCKALVSSGGYKSVVGCLLTLMGQSGNTVGSDSCIFLACDTIMNLLLKKERMGFRMDESTYVDLLKALGSWAGDSNDLSIIMMAASICALILDYTSEEALLAHPKFSSSSLSNLYRLMARSLTSHKQATPDFIRDEMDLLDIVTSGFSRWADRFPDLRRAVE